MTRRKSLSDDGVKNLKPRAARYAHPDPEMRGHYVRVTPAGAKSYVALARDPDGKQIWATIGSTDLKTVDEARAEARKAINRIKDGLPPFEEREKAETFNDVADDFIKRHVDKKGLRSKKEIERLLDRHVRPRWGDREFKSIRRASVVALLDEVEDDHSARQADYVLAIVRKIANWYAARHDDYDSPIVPGMRRTDPKETKRDRTLNEDEIKKVWRHAEKNGRFGAIVRLALLTAQRREKLGSMRWADITADGVWNMPVEDRAKGVGGALQLPEAARKIIAEQNRVGENPYVFPGRGDGCFNSWSKCKKAFDEKVSIAPWVIHDLRRTARTLMAEAGVRPDIAERTLGHAIGGVEGIYDRSKYTREKAEALKQLAAKIEGIINPKQNVVPIKRGRR
jgi:integrase